MANDSIDVGPVVLVLGGSQGSEFLNQTVPLAATALAREVSVIHASGPDHFSRTAKRVTELGIMDRYSVFAYLNTEEMVDAYRKATVVVARSGGTLAELALFGLPSVLVPLPNSANDHQLHNAEEFEKMSSATILNQSQATPEAIASAIGSWLDDPSRRQVARKNLQSWDAPDAADRIVQLIKEASR